MSTVRIQLRRGLAAQWTSVNPVLAGGEAGFESDTLKIKIGDGTTNWNSLGYATVTPQNLTDAIAGVVAGEIADYATLTELSSAIAQEVSDRNDAIATAVSAVVSGEDFIGLAEKGTSNGVAELDSAGKVPDTQINSDIARVTNVTSDIATAKSQAISTSESYTDSAISTEVTGRNSAISTAKSEAESYTDSQITNAIEVSNTYTDTKVAGLVNSAPGVLNTLKKIDDAINNFWQRPLKNASVS